MIFNSLRDRLSKLFARNQEKAEAVEGFSIPRAIKAALSVWRARQLASRDYHRQVRYAYKHLDGANRKTRLAMRARWRAARGKAKTEAAELSAKLDRAPLVPALAVIDANGCIVYLPKPTRARAS